MARMMKAKRKAMRAFEKKWESKYFIKIARMQRAALKRASALKKKTVKKLRRA